MKELKKKHSSRPVGGAETHSNAALEDWGGGGRGWLSEWSHICVQINWEEQLGSETDRETQGSSVGK